MPINRMNEYTVAQSYNGVLYSNEKETTATCNNMNEFHPKKVSTV